MQDFSTIGLAAQPSGSTNNEQVSMPVPTGEVIYQGAIFSDLLGSGGAGVVSGTEVISGGGNANALGDRIVARLDAIGDEFKTNMARAHETFEKSPQDISLRELMKVQFEMAVVTLQVEVVGKGVQKSVQHVDTLVKMQ